MRRYLCRGFLWTLLLLALTCGRDDAPREAPPSAPIDAALFERAPPPRPPRPPRPRAARAPRSLELTPAKDLVGVFPVPEGARLLREVGELSELRAAEDVGTLARFYRRQGFVVMQKGGRATVRPAQAAGKADFLSIRPARGRGSTLLVKARTLRRGAGTSK
jgi:hypothetical protein